MTAMDSADEICRVIATRGTDILVIQFNAMYCEAYTLTSYNVTISYIFTDFCLMENRLFFNCTPKITRYTIASHIIKVLYPIYDVLCPQTKVAFTKPQRSK